MSICKFPQLNREGAVFIGPGMNNTANINSLSKLVYIKSGFGKRIVGDHVGEFKDGDIVLLGPELPHHWRGRNEGGRSGIAKSDSTARYRWLNPNEGEYADVAKSVDSTIIYFPPDFLVNLTDDRSVSFQTEGLVRRSQRGLEFYGKTREKVAGKIDGLQKENGLGRVSAFLNVIDALSSSEEYNYLASVSYKNLLGGKINCRERALFRFLQENFKRELSLHEVASVVCMSSGSFCRFFKNRTGKSFSLFVNELRISYACKLLMNDDYSVSSVAYESGFQCMSNFNKFFRRITGETPSQYKDKLNALC